MLKGFFNKRTALDEIKIKSKFGCEICKLYKEVRSPKMSYTGEGKTKALIVGETGGKTEDFKGIQFVGEAGQVLRKHLSSFGFNLDIDFWKTNVVACRTSESNGSNRNPTDKEIKCCRDKWRAEVEELKPNHIFLMGKSAVKAFFMDRGKKIKSNLEISRWRKLCIPDPWSKAWVICLYHPSFVLHNPDAEHIFQRDLKWALSCLNLPEPEFVDYSSKVKRITNFDEISQVLNSLLQEKIISIDYETTALRPFFYDQEIVSIAIGKAGKAFAFPFSYPNLWVPAQIKKLHISWKKFLENYKGKIITHSIQMEKLWTNHMFKVEPNWFWDTMVTSHIIDERDEFTSLDFQTFINWGYEYGEKIEEYKEGFPKNRMQEAPLNLLLEYNGLDALFTRMLWEKQTREIEKQKLQEAKDLFFDALLEFSDMEGEGICLNKKYFEEKDKELKFQIAEVEKRLEESEEAKAFKEKTSKDLNFNSPKDLPELLFDILGKEAKTLTKTGKPSVDKNVIASLEGAFFDDLNLMRKLKKIKDTYIKGFLKVPGERLHINLNLHTVKSYRSSSSAPQGIGVNIQNIPKHNESANKLIRTGIRPSLNNKLASVDYGSHEIRILACISEDSNLILDLENGVDLHQVYADELGINRFDSKNTVIFPEFYGSNYETIWKNLIALKYKISLSRVKEVENQIWKRYKETKKWQENVIRQYEINGHIKMPWGFKRRGFLTRNKLINAPVQSAAFHCLLWSLIKIRKISKERGWKTRLLTEIHDDLLFDMYPPEEEEVVKIVTDIMKRQIREENPWIKAPLEVEWTIGEIDKSWTELKG